jgi:hypothetical protein
MFLSNPAKYFLAIALILSSTAGCGLLRSDQNAVTPVVAEPKNRFPFKTKEPENFQCEIVETAGEVVRRKRLAKKGNWRRIDLDFGEKTQRSLLQTDKEYLLDIGRGVYAETASGGGVQYDELTHELLNTGSHAEFEETGREGGIIRYSVRPADSESSEIVVSYDESLGMPIKQEYFSLEGGERVLQLTVEVVNFINEPDAGIFSVPSGLRRVSLDELLEASRKIS